MNAKTVSQVIRKGECIIAFYLKSGTKYVVNQSLSTNAKNANLLKDSVSIVCRGISTSSTESFHSDLGRMNNYKNSTANLILSNNFCHSTDTRSCWKCSRNIHRQKEMYFCAPCNVIQSPDKEANYFEMLDSPVTFDIDLDHISSKHKELQMLMHPDRFVQKSEIERQFADLQSSLINKAYRKLKRPISRAQYLLKLSGNPQTDGEIQELPIFLMEIMELNEQLADKNISTKLIRAIGEENSRNLKELYVKLSLAFKEKDYDLAKQILAKIKYYANIEEKVNQLLVERGAMGG